MSVTQISLSRFHHFHLARQLEKLGLLDGIWTGYPRFKLKDEPGIPITKIHSFPWLHTPAMAGLFGLARIAPIRREWYWWDVQSLDYWVAKQIRKPTTLVSVAATGLQAGRKAQALGGRYVCDLPTSHIRHRNQVLCEEYQRWKVPFLGIDPRELAKQEAELEQADAITVASEYSRRTCLAAGVPEGKLKKIPYGVRLERFQKNGEPDRGRFQILWVGHVSVAKGFMDLLTAFQQFKHPNKSLVAIGMVHGHMSSVLRSQNLEGVKFKGQVLNADLSKYYSQSHVFAFPSIDDGFGMVMGEALACGCPVIASNHTGAEDFIQEGKEGFIVPIRSPEAICDRLERIAQAPTLREEMSTAALARMKCLGGWEAYGNAFGSFLNGLASDHA